VPLAFGPSAPMPAILWITFRASSSHPPGNLPLCQVDVRFQ
jgi:hypothetical protein